MHGPDVEALQEALIKRGQHVTADGQFGPLTVHAVGVVAWNLGLKKTVAVPAVQRIIEGKLPRSPLDVRRAKQRAAKAKQASQGLAGVLSNAKRFVGVHENPAGSNTGYPEPNGWESNFAMHAVSWCGCFAGSMILLAGGHVDSRVAYCPSIEADAKSGLNGFERWTTDHRQAKAGWLALYCWDGTGVPEHVGVVEKFTASGPVTVEGNTSSGDEGSQSNGGMVAERQRAWTNVVGYAKPRF